MDENIVQVLNSDGSISYEVLEENALQTSASSETDIQKTTPEVLSVTDSAENTDVIPEVSMENNVEVIPRTVTLDTIHSDLMMIFFIMLFAICHSMIKSGFRAWNKWNKGDK